MGFGNFYALIFERDAPREGTPVPPGPPSVQLNAKHSARFGSSHGRLRKVAYNYARNEQALGTARTQQQKFNKGGTSRHGPYSWAGSAGRGRKARQHLSS